MLVDLAAALLLATAVFTAPPAELLDRLNELERAEEVEAEYIDPGFEVWEGLEKELRAAAAASSDAEMRLRLELGRYRAAARTARSLPYDSTELTAAQKKWLAAHESEVVYNEIGGNYLLIVDRLWELHGKAQGDLADDVAFTAAKAALGGECEGYMPCYLEATLMCEGRYLELHPRGKHAAELVEGIYWLNEEMDVDPDLDPEGRAEARAALAKMRRLLAATTIPKRDQALKNLDALDAALAKAR